MTGRGCLNPEYLFLSLPGLGGNPYKHLVVERRRFGSTIFGLVYRYSGRSNRIDLTEGNMQQPFTGH